MTKTTYTVNTYGPAALGQCASEKIVMADPDFLPHAFTLHLGDGSRLLVEVSVVDGEDELRIRHQRDAGVRNGAP